ncbi:stage III sporulation protein AG [Collibacillus ludicampi]|jgi:stage III sporulation protein AG|uniref:Stage III sporulation protein AG n=1 Tax=Collibacillus ludicampi TaxID=2771369 RepID=A0AAV4L9U4_9BACL|nr:stage III sporulation protein AG [Collibacillus ludicampi]GIM44558.1 stage III sporulation protein AG [Collibacillus ludicampi]
MPFDWKSLSRKPKWLWVLGLLGVFLLFGGSLFPTNQNKTSPQAVDPAHPTVSTDQPSTHDFEKMYETRLTEMLNQLQGVSDVSVMVNLDSTEEVLYATNDQNNKTTTNETDKQGGTRVTTQMNENNQILITKDGDGDHPVVVKRVKPHVRGVLVMAKGAENPRVQLAILDAIQRVLDVPAFKISIQPKK